MGVVIYPAMAGLAYCVWKILTLARADADLSTFGRRINRDALEGKTVWVSGASSGIGEAIALKLAEHGCALVLSARRRHALEQVRASCLARNPGISVTVVVLDVTDEKACTAAAKNVVREHGCPAYLVSCVGRSQRALVEETEVSVDKEMLDLNVTANIALTKAILPYMVEKKQGHIAVVSSLAGKIPTPLGASYAATKHALQGFYNTLRIEMFKHNIKVTMLCPGQVDTPGAVTSFTGKKGEVTGEKFATSKGKMSPERCAELSVAGISNGLTECWISRHPLLLFAYVFQYCPSVATAVSNKFGQTRIQAYKSGNPNVNSSFFSGILGRKRAD